jgi:hypothetical protein
MTQYVINIGAIPNDGTGDPLRTAFNETNLNFDQVFAAGPVLSNIQIANNKILTTNTNGNLVLAPNGTGVIQANVSIVPNLANLRNLGSATNRWSTVYTQYLNATQINLTGDLTVAGNLTVQGNIIQVGNIVTDSLTIQLANTAGTANSANGAGITVGLNDNIATLLYNSTGNVWTTNIGLSSVGNITAPYFFGNGSQLTGLAATYGNANVANYLPTFTGNIATGNLTANTVGINGNLWSFTTTGAAAGGSYLYSPTGGSWYADPNFEDDFIYSAPGGFINIGTLHANSEYASQIHLEQDTTQIIMGPTGAQQIWSFDDFGNLTLPGNTFAVNYANGNPVSLGGNYGNANVATFMAAFGNNTISTTGNITSNYYVGNVAVLAGQNTRGEHAANLGTSGFTELNSNVILQITGNANSYAQINFQNIGNGTAATTDYIATAQFGTDSTYFVDMGIASGTYDSSNPDNSLGNSLYAQDSYLYAQGGNSYGGSGGNLVVGSNEPGGVVRIIADGSTTDNIVATFSNVGVDVKGNIIPAANAVYSLGNSTNYWANLWVANNTIYIGGVPLGMTAGNVLTVDGNAVLTNGSNTAVSTTGNITAGNLISPTLNNSGNISVVANGNTWIFGTDGATIFPTLTVTRGDTTGTLTGQALLFGDSAQEALISTPDGVANVTPNSQRLVINPGQGAPGTTGEGGDIYLYAGRGGDAGGSGGDIKIRGGLGPVDGAGGYITMEGGEADVDGIGGYIEIFGGVSGNAAGGTLYIQGGQGRTGGDANVSGGFGVTGPGGTVSIIGGGSANGQAEYGNIFVATGSKNWTFDNTGNLALPQGGVVYETNIPDGGLNGKTIALVPSGGTNADQQLLIYPTVNDANHLHLTTGNLYNTELFLGDDNLYVKLANTGNVVVNSNDGAGNTAQWIFGTDSRLTFPGTPRIDTDANNFEVQAAESISLEANAVVNIYTDTSGTAYQWQFGDDGNLTVPGGMIINGNINTLGSQTALLQPTDDLPLAFIASGANGSVISYWAEDIANLMSSNIAAIYTPLQNTQTVRIVTGTNGGNIAIYDFDKNGVFSTAQVSATGNVTGNYFIGNGSLLTGISASLPVANGTSNFDIATANGNVTITANAETYTFGTNSTLTLPGGSQLRPVGANLDLVAGTGAYVNLITSDGNSYMGVDNGGGYIATAGGTWNFGTTGNLTAPGNISAVGNITSGNLTVGSGTITGGNVNGAVFNGNVAFGTGTVGGSGNITGGNLITTGSGGNITMTGGNITGAGNISAGNLIATGNIVLTGSLVGSGASPAPSLSGFSSVSAITVSASGNITGGNLISSATIYGNVDVVLGNIANTSATKTRIVSFDANSYIQTGNGISGTTGNIIFSPYTDATARVSIDTSSGNLTAAGNILAGGGVVTAPVALANLTAIAGGRAFVNNANLVAAGNFGNQVGSGGSNVVPVWSDGSNWYIG